MKANNYGIKFILSRLITTMLVVATFTFATLRVPFMNDAIAAPQPSFAAVKTQDKMADEQNRAQDDQNNPDGVEFGLEDEARILGADDTLDKLKGIFGGGSKDQSSASAASRKSAKTSTEDSKNISASAVNNVERTVGETDNLSDRSTIKAKRKAKQDIN